VQKFLQKDQLAREEHILYIPGAKIFEIRAEQGLPPVQEELLIKEATRESLKAMDDASP